MNLEMIMKMFMNNDNETRREKDTFTPRKKTPQEHNRESFREKAPLPQGFR